MAVVVVARSSGLSVAGALRAGVTSFVTYDARQRDSALAVGLIVEALS